MKGERNRRATRSRVSIIFGIGFGVIVACWLFILCLVIYIGVDLRDDLTSQRLTVLLLPVLFPAGLLVYGLIEGLRANQEVRRRRAEGEKSLGISLVFAAILLIALLLIVLLVISTQIYCTAHPFRCALVPF